MDPVSQGALGSVLPQSVWREPGALAAVGLAGWLAGMLPDLDVLIRSSDDPLLFLEFHRQFTHALVFIPIGGLLAALGLFPLLRRRLSFRLLYAATTLGYGTHGLLDACTSYGTQLYWPFSDARVAWSNVSIIDPLFTLPLLVGVLLAGFRRRRRFAVLGLVWAVGYLCLGVVQRERAEAAAEALAKERGHIPARIEAKPSFGNLILWKVLYEHEERFFVDAVRVTLGAKIYPGSSVAKLDVGRDFPALEPDSRQARDIERFRWFSQGYVASDPARPGFIGDIRYSLLPHEVAPLWGIVIDPSTPHGHVRFENARDGVLEKRGVFLRMLAGAPLPGVGEGVRE